MIRKNVASQYVYFVLVNAATGAALTGATVTARRALDNAAQASATGTTTELGNGQYRFNLSQADTNADYIGLLFTAANAIPVSISIVTTAGNFADAAAFGMTNLDTTVSSRATPAQVNTEADTAIADAALATAANLATVAGYVDTEVAAIKAKTDQLSFGVAGKVDANITHVNEVEVAGDGSATPWGPV